MSEQRENTGCSTSEARDFYFYLLKLVNNISYITLKQEKFPTIKKTAA